jgi:ABC-type multidrug transport system fused ATPase/permease subunit
MLMNNIVGISGMSGAVKTRFVTLAQKFITKT